MKNIGYLKFKIVQENSVEVQSKLISDFCKNNNIVLDEVVIDEGISGSGDKTHKRNGYNSVIERIGKIEVNVPW